MNDTAISVRNLGKSYRIGEIERKAASVQEYISRIALSPFKYLKMRMSEATEDEILWALKDVSFDVKQGEVVGVIGPNGAGKSTLLKILSMITDPTEGHAELHGRVNSLLEVGTGFHPELTGRENIYLTAAIHGMSRKEVSEKFDEILEFSGVEKFIDTPLKRYSSGMRVRLGFAVAAHLRPEILLIDEVLAVGDVAFQQKCLGRIGDVAEGGRTVLFVSHNMLAVRALCKRTILMDHGKLVADGETEDVVAQYLSTNTVEEGCVSWVNAVEQPGSECCRMLAIRTRNQAGHVTGQFQSDEPILVEFEFDSERIDENFAMAFDLSSGDGVTLFRSAHTDMEEESWPRLKVGRNRVQCMIPGDLLGVGLFLIAVKMGIHFGPWIVNTPPLLSIHIVSGRPKSRFWMPRANRNQAISPVLTWRDV